jgi:hypothetical protein
MCGMGKVVAMGAKMGRKRSWLRRLDAVAGAVVPWQRCVMKTVLCCIFTIAGLTILHASPGECCGGRPCSKEQKRSTPSPVTGTAIQRDIARVGNTYDMPTPVKIIDRRRIERSGQSTLVGVLRKDPLFR